MGTKGSEMRRRLIGAFDGGMRRGEMLLTQIKHVNWTPIRLTVDGRTSTAYEIVLPPDVTKGGKTSGEDEVIYAATPRFREMLDERRFQLRRRTPAGKMEPDPEAYIFGTEAGRYQQDFDKMWHTLFALAGLDYGRDTGLVWHTTRHEFISRIAEKNDDSVTREMARHKDLRTTNALHEGARAPEARGGCRTLSGVVGGFFGDHSGIDFQKDAVLLGIHTGGGTVRDREVAGSNPVAPTTEFGK